MTMCFYRDRQHFSFFKRLKNIKIVVSLQDVLTGKWKIVLMAAL